MTCASAPSFCFAERFALCKSYPLLLLQDYKNIYLPVTLECAQEFVSVTFTTPTATRVRHSVAMNQGYIASSLTTTTTTILTATTPTPTKREKTQQHPLHWGSHHQSAPFLALFVARIIVWFVRPNCRHWFTASFLQPLP